MGTKPFMGIARRESRDSCEGSRTSLPDPTTGKNSLCQSDYREKKGRPEIRGGNCREGPSESSKNQSLKLRKPKSLIMWGLKTQVIGVMRGSFYGRELLQPVSGGRDSTSRGGG